MQGIYIMAGITTLAALLIFGTALWFIARPEERLYAFAALVVALPLSPLAFYLVRVPLISLINSTLHPESNSALALVIQFLYAPLTEEPAKLLPLLLPTLRRNLTARSYVAYACALGLGFGIGEVWLIANQLANVPEYASLPFFQFGAFLIERLTVMPTHALFTAAALRGITHGKPAVGVLAAMGLHLLGNAPIALIVLDVGGLGRVAWQAIVSLLTSIYGITAVVILLTWRVQSDKSVVPAAPPPANDASVPDTP